MSIQNALNAFISDNGGATFEQAVKDSTYAGFSGSGYSVELFDDGAFRVLWNGQIGNLYRSPGVILAIPQFDQVTVSDMEKYGGDADLDFAMEEAKAAIREALAMKVEA